MKSIWINGKSYQPDRDTRNEKKSSAIGGFGKDILNFIRDWQSGKDRFELLTSGSTGVPKKVILQRKQMIASAEMTLDFLKISKGGRIFLCLHPGYVAGMMVIVRALVGNLDLYAVSPVADPFNQAGLDYGFDLTSLVPYQLYTVLERSESSSNLRKVKNVLVGGADVSGHLIGSLSGFENNIYQTFGMTETVSHIALRRLAPTPPSSTYRVLEGIKVEVDSRNCLTIKGRVTDGKKIITNDVVELKGEKEFIWKGRTDQIINSGGIKINVPELEGKIRDVLTPGFSPCELFIIGQPDTKLGERIILVIQADPGTQEKLYIKNLLKKNLPKYEVPKAYYYIREFPRTPTGKINKTGIVRSLGLGV